MNPISNDHSLIDWGVAAKTMPGHTESGDQYVVEPFPGGILTAVIDGLGHGIKAAEAAKSAVEILKANAGESVVSLLRNCHGGLRHSRGAVMSLASFNGLQNTMTWLGIGNVEGILLRADAKAKPTETLFLRGGVVGYQIPSLRDMVIPLSQDDTLIFVTDGIRSGFVKGLTQSKSPLPTQNKFISPQQIADHIMAHHSRDTDDALVLVVRYRGNSKQ